MKKNIILILLLMFIISISAFGQSYNTFKSDLNQIKRRAKWRVGPFRFFPIIQLNNIGYDDNVYYQPETRNPISDYTATFSPQIKVYFLFRNWFIFSLTENPEYVFYFKQKRERRWNNTLYPEFKFLFLNRFVISGSYSSITKRRRATSEFDVRANMRTKSYSGRFFYETARRTSFGFYGLIEKISFEDITYPEEEIYLSRALNRTQRTSNFEFYYKIFSESYFFLSAGYTEYQFEHVQARWRDSYSYQAYSGIRFPVFGRIRGTFSLGYKILVPFRTNKKGFSGLVGNSRLDLRIKRFYFRLQYLRDCMFSFWTNNIFFLEDRYGLGISFYLTSFLRLDYDYSYANAIYPEKMTMRMPDKSYQDISRHDIYRNHIFGFVVRIIRNTGLGLRAFSWQRDSNIPGVDRKRLFIGGYITYEF